MRIGLTPLFCAECEVQCLTVKHLHPMPTGVITRCQHCNPVVFEMAVRLMRWMRPPAVLRRITALMLGKGGAFGMAMAGDQSWCMHRLGD